VEILFKSENYIIVNKPKDVFINNHNKEVSNYCIPVLLFKYNILNLIINQMFLNKQIKTHYKFFFHCRNHLWIY